MAKICEDIVAEAPQSTELALMALRYTTRLFAYGERFYIPSSRDQGRGWLKFDPNDERFADAHGVFDKDKARAMMTKVLEEILGLPEKPPQEDREQAVLLAEVASDVDRVVSVKAMGLRQWRIEVNEPWLQSGGRERLHNELKDRRPTTPAQDLLKRLDIDSIPACLTSEALRVKEVLRVADSLVDGGLTRLVDNFTREGTYLGWDMLRLFCEVLYEGPVGKNPIDYRRMDSFFGMLATGERISPVFQQIKFLVNYLEKGGGSEPLEEFIQAIISKPWVISVVTSYMFVVSHS